MASFVEEAVLKVVDQSSKPIAKINAELAKLFATAKSLKSMKIDLSVKDTGLSKAAFDVRRLASELRQIKSAGRINLSVNTAGLNQATRQLQQLRSQARQPINVTMGGGGGRGVGGGQPGIFRQVGGTIAN